jgi:hypothetical protein
VKKAPTNFARLKAEPAKSTAKADSWEEF